MRLSKNFTLQEIQSVFDDLACKCGCGYNESRMELLIVLLDLATHFGAMLDFSSGCRCKKHNKKEGGATFSQHLYGRAADVKLLYSPGQIDPADVADYLQYKYPDKYGIGRYAGFTHIDVRKKKARWRG